MSQPITADLVQILHTSNASIALRADGGHQNSNLVFRVSLGGGPTPDFSSVDFNSSDFKTIP
jgi:hypothetical protein